MNMGVCVGGITFDGRLVRLLDNNGHNQSNGCPYKINEVYEVAFIEKQNPIPPHIEDILVQSSKYVEQLKDDIRMINVITKRNINICKGRIGDLFDKCLKFTNNGSGYINSLKIPQNSVSFWIADKDLIKNIDSNGKIRYQYQTDFFSSDIQIKYVGFQPAEDIISKGTLLRVSLARWWAPDDEVENRCYLQLSGWYK